MDIHIHQNKKKYEAYKIYKDIDLAIIKDTAYIYRIKK